MAVKQILNAWQRSFKKVSDVDEIQNCIFNEAAGVQKVMNIEPVIKDVYSANDSVPFGSYIKLASGTTDYTVSCVGKDHNPNSKYQIAQIVVEGGQVYVANKDIKNPKAFDVQDWTRVAPATIAGIPVDGASTICVGKWHNSINVSGFLVEDDTTITPRR